MKIIGITLSNNPNSVNRIALENVLEHVGGYCIPFADLDFPMFKMGDTAPDTLDAVCKDIISADKIIFSTPEYNGTFSPYGKNVLDWISTQGTFCGGKKQTPLSGKHTMVMAVAPGKLGGVRALPSVSHVLMELGCVVVATGATTGGFQPDTYDYTTLYSIADTFKAY